MKYEERFWYTGTSLKSSIVPFEEEGFQCIGKASEYNPIAGTTTHFNNPLCLVIKKEINSQTKLVSPVSIPEFDPETVGGYHSSDFNCNGGFILSKSDLEQIINTMEDKDSLYIVAPDNINWDKFDRGVKEVTNQKKHEL